MKKELDIYVKNHDTRTKKDAIKESIRMAELHNRRNTSKEHGLQVMKSHYKDYKHLIDEKTWFNVYNENRACV